METIADNSNCRNWMKITRFARFRQNTQRNKQILNLVNSSIKYIRIHYEGRNNTEEVKQRQRIPLSCKNAQTTLTCGVVMLACLVAAASVTSTT